MRSPAASEDESTAAPAHPRLALHLRPEIVPGEGLYLLAEPDPIHFPGEVFEALSPLLDGQRSIEEVFAALAGRCSPHEVFEALDRLRMRGLLREGPARPDGPMPDPAAVAFWDAQGAEGSSACARLGELVVSVTVLGDRPVSPWIEALRAQGIRVGEHGSMALVVANDYLDPAVAAFDARARAEGRPWVLVRPWGARPWLGPLFVPSRTGCAECLAHRLRGHRRLQAHLQRALGRPPGPPVMEALPSTITMVAGIVVTELSRWSLLGRSLLEGTVVTLELSALERRIHRLVRRPQCPACGNLRPSASRAPWLGIVDRPVTSGQDGGWRTCTPEETIERLQHHVSPITGIIAAVEPRLASGSPLTPIYVTDHSFAQMDTERWFLREGFRKRSGGKGCTSTQALASALCESIERYCGVWQGDEPCLRATREALGPAALHPNDCMGFSERQYVERERWNAFGSKVRHVPQPFHDRLVLDWTPLWSLVDRSLRYLPAAQCYYGYPPEGGPRIAVADSNGCAAGNTLFEAALQGVLELVERDCVALWWYNRLRRPGVALESFDAPYLLELREHYRILERELWAIDITSDLGIPAFAAVSRRVDQPREDVLLGFGAHVDARVALVRAMTEVNQSLPSVPSHLEGPEARLRGDNHEALRWWSTATVASEPYLAPAPDLPVSTLADHPPPPSGSLADQLHRCVERLHAQGLHPLVLDQSRPDVELSVARVVVPGLRHFWPRFGPGRLYDVPVARGWCAAPLLERQLNRHVVYF